MLITGRQAAFWTFSLFSLPPHPSPCGSEDKGPRGKARKATAACGSGFRVWTLAPTLEIGSSASRGGGRGGGQVLAKGCSHDCNGHTLVFGPLIANARWRVGARSVGVPYLC